MALAGPSPLRAEPAPDRQRTEFGIVPLVGGDTDVGVGVGQLSTIAGLPPPSSRVPYRWAVESSAFISFKEEAGKVIIPVRRFLRPVDRAGAAWRPPAPRGAPLFHARVDPAVLRPGQRVGRARQRRAVARLLRPHPPDAVGARAVPLLGPDAGGVRVVLFAELAENTGRRHAGAADGHRRRDGAAPARRHRRPRRADPRRAAALRFARQRARHRQRPVPPDQAAASARASAPRSRTPTSRSTSPRASFSR